MPKKDDYGDFSISETGNWNVADKYTKNKIMRPLNLCDYYEDIARFGYDSLVDELINYNALPNDVIKYKAIVRLVNELIRLIDNTKFALKNGSTRKDALGYKANLIMIKISLPNLVRVARNHVDHTSSTQIKNYVLFDKYLDNIAIIKSKLNEPLNKNHLIFTDKEEFDPKAWKKRIADRIVNQG